MVQQAHVVETQVAAQEDVLSLQYRSPVPVFQDKYEERRYVKERLALAYRVIARECHPEGASGHLTVRDPVDPTCFWVNPYGLHFSLITSSSLLLISHTGQLLPSGLPSHQIFNSAAFIIHSSIHASRPEINAIVHAHCPHGKAFSTLGRGLPFYTQDSAVFWDDISLYASHGGVVLSKGEAGEIGRSLGKKKAVIMQNHGCLTVGGCIESAVAWFMLLENECRCILTAESAAAFTGKPPVSLLPEVAEFTRKETGSEEAGRFEALSFFDLVQIECKAAHKE